MSQITLISPQERPLQPMIEAALQNELRLLEAGLHRTDMRVRHFETQYGMSTSEFLRKYQNDEVEETLEFVEWVGEFRMRERLQEKIKTLREIRFAN
ncbi:MAG: hypothetical protein HZC40_08530 [Chloroflexi bacterium]|nr:hypothetical protein [Chloroflexota bacterium]